MITAKTCLVLGAGASAPYGLPPAGALRDLILVTKVPSAIETALQYSPDAGKFRHPISYSSAQRTKHVRNAWRDLLNAQCTETSYFSSAQFQAFREAFFRSKFQSVDKFLQWNAEEFADIGRINIATVLLACEQISHLDKDWYEQLLQDVIPNGPADLEGGKLSVVTFNYDRSFERFFLDALEAGFRLDPQEARTAFSHIELIHVYGDLGELEEVRYGDLSVVHNAAKNITLARAGCENAKAEEINRILTEAETICFIGFSFGPENICLFDRSILKGKTVIATSLGMSGAREQEVRRAFPGIGFFDGSAHELLKSRNIFQKRARRVSPNDHLPVKRSRSTWMGDLGTGWRV